jgi:hypothetical protein
MLDMFSHPGVSPTSVLAVKKRYLPLRSKAGYLASLMPSVTWLTWPVSSE